MSASLAIYDDESDVPSGVPFTRCSSTDGSLHGRPRGWNRMKMDQESEKIGNNIIEEM